MSQNEDDLLKHEEKGGGDGGVPEPPTVGWRILNFVDDTQVRVKGLDEILAAVYDEGRQVSDETAEEIINRLEAKKNYIPSSDRAHKEFRYVLLKEYRRYVKDRADKTTGKETAP